jgi:hypothetical protein
LQATCLNNPPSCNTSSVTISASSPLSDPIVSTGGRFVAYDVANGMIDGTPLTSPMVFVYDSCIGAAPGCVTRTLPVCLNASGAIANNFCRLAGMNSDGQYILFSSGATNLGPTPQAQNSISYIVKNPLI